MISKELLCEVLELKKIDEIYQEDNLLYFCESNKGINIYELTFKCKEWANTQGYTIIDYIDLDNEEFWTCRAYPNGLNDGFDYEAIYQPSSQVSIFKACEWIMENKCGS